MKPKEEEFKQELLTHDDMVHRILTSHMIPKDLFDKKGELKQETLEEAAELALFFHNTYEKLAPYFGYETRQDTKDFDFNSPNGKLMVAVCSEVIKWQAERMYSEEDLEVAFFEGRENNLPFTEWFKQFKKK
jgi:hypothetical protein